MRCLQVLDLGSILDTTKPQSDYDDIIKGSDITKRIRGFAHCSTEVRVCPLLPLLACLMMAIWRSEKPSEVRTSEVNVYAMAIIGKFALAYAIGRMVVVSSIKVAYSTFLGKEAIDILMSKPYDVPA